jgi:hypothetical protein
MLPRPLVDLWSAYVRDLAAIPLLSLAVVGLAGVLVYQAWRGPVAYVSCGPGMVRADVIEDDVALGFAEWLLEQRYTFTYATVKTMQARVRRVLHPALTKPFEAQADREAREVRDAKMSAQLTVSEAVVTDHPTPTSVVVQLQARRTVSLGGQEVRTEPLQATITLRVWRTYTRLPLGEVALVVTGLRTSPALTVTGD